MLPAAAFASGDLQGTVLDGKGEPVPFASVVLLSGTDSTVMAAASASEDGSFNIPAEGNNHLLMVSMIGYKTQYMSASDNITVTLQPDVQALEGAAVTAVIPKTTLTGEGLQTSVRGTVLETAGTANDVLARTPGVIKSQDGLQVIGKGAPLVYVNGRKLTDMDELDRLQSNEIQSVEVIMNPGSQYDASVNSVVRIRTVRHQGDGLGFSVGLSDEQSLHSSFNDPSGFLNANYRHNALDIFAGVNVRKFT